MMVWMGVKDVVRVGIVWEGGWEESEWGMDDSHVDMREKDEDTVVLPGWMNSVIEQE